MLSRRLRASSLPSCARVRYPDILASSLSADDALSPAYGEYNDQVREVAGMRGQSIVTWDFEYVQMPPSRPSCSLACFSGGDGVGVSADDNKAHYDQIASQHPDTILALQHEVYCV